MAVTAPDSRARSSSRIVSRLQVSSSQRSAAAHRANESQRASSGGNGVSRSKALSATSQTPCYYQFAFLQPGTYTIAFTCQADQDNPDQADAAVTFSPVNTGIVVTANMTTTADLP